MNLNYYKVIYFKAKYIIIFFFQIDKPKFGEIVHEPPTLTLPKRSKFDKSKVIFNFLIGLFTN